MGRVFGFLISIIVVSITVTCVFADSSTEYIDKPSDGLSTASDTLTKEAESIFADGFNSKELRDIREAADKKPFQAEVDRMMKIIISSLYRNKEIFLRELISNASDALDKIRMQSLLDSDVLKDTEELTIRIKANKESRTLHIIDTGVGMTGEELNSILGSIAKSGTAEFLSALSSSNRTGDASDLIGQFGVGFYSSFLVADKVTVITKNINDKQHIWESDSSYFTVFEDPRGNTLKRGTEIILHLTPESEDFLDQENLKKLIKKYSQFINFPIYVWASRTEMVKEDPIESDAPQTDESSDDSKVSTEDTEADKKPEPKTVEKVVWEWEHVNKFKPVWTRKPADVTDQEYIDLYQAISGDSDKPLGKIHFSAEGDVAFKAVLFIPKRPPPDFFHGEFSAKSRLKLYVHRVFIADSGEELIPKYLAFIMGVVDSDDLGINISRETLQESSLMKIIKRKIVRKVIEMIQKLPEEDFLSFWEAYSVQIKLALSYDNTNRGRFSKILRFHTSHNPDNQTSLDGYVSRMKKDQESIYFLTASSVDEASGSPLVERLVKKGYEVLYMVSPIDEYLVQSLTEYEKKPLKNVATGALKLSPEEETKKIEETFKDLIKWLESDALKDKIDSARISDRLADSPCAIVAVERGWSGNMERVFTSQSHQIDSSTLNYYKNQKKVLEINPRHPLIKELSSRVAVDRSDKEAMDAARMLFDTAFLRSGYGIIDPIEFARNIEFMVRKNLNVDENETADDEPEPASMETDNPIESDETTEDFGGNIAPETVDTEPIVSEADEVSQKVGEKDEL